MNNAASSAFLQYVADFGRLINIRDFRKTQATAVVVSVTQQSGIAVLGK
jgi:hypothetical protein